VVIKLYKQEIKRAINSSRCTELKTDHWTSTYYSIIIRNCRSTLSSLYL